jgi:hypothetical protein
MTMENESVQDESVQNAGWYVSRVVNLPDEGADFLGLLGGVVSPAGATLRIGEPIERERPLEDHRSYAATLSFPGLFAGRVKVELVVARYSGSLAEVGLRPASRVPQRRIGATRYFEAAWAVLDAVAQAARAEPAERLVPRASSRRFARAS